MASEPEQGTSTVEAATARVGDRVEVHPGKEVVVDFDPSLTFECVEDCTWCCHHGVLLYEPDFLELANCASLAEATTTVRGEEFVRTESKDRESFVDGDGEACVFLREDGRCSLHAEHDWKPTRCSIFPLAVRVENGEIHVSVRDAAAEHCDGLDVSERRVVENLEAFLPPVLWELDDPATRRVL